MVSTRRTRAQMEENASTDPVAASSDSIFSPRKTRSGRPRALQPAACNNSMPVNEPKVTRSSKTAVIKRRGRPPKKATTKICLDPDDKLSQPTSSASIASPDRRPLIEVASGRRQQAIPLSGSTEKIASPTRVELSNAEKLSVYQSPQADGPVENLCVSPTDAATNTLARKCEIVQKAITDDASTNQENDYGGSLDDLTSGNGERDNMAVKSFVDDQNHATNATLVAIQPVVQHQNDCFHNGLVYIEMGNSDCMPDCTPKPKGDPASLSRHLDCDGKDDSTTSLAHVLVSPEHDHGPLLPISQVPRDTPISTQLQADRLASPLFEETKSSDTAHLTPVGHPHTSQHSQFSTTVVSQSSCKLLGSVVDPVPTKADTSTNDKSSSAVLETDLALDFTPVSLECTIFTPRRIDSISKQASRLSDTGVELVVNDTEVMESCYRTPGTPGTTWIDGVEVPLPPDEWSPTISRHRDSSFPTDETGQTDMRDHASTVVTVLASHRNSMDDSVDKSLMADVSVEMQENTAQHASPVTLGTTSVALTDAKNTEHESSDFIHEPGSMALGVFYASKSTRPAEQMNPSQISVMTETSDKLLPQDTASGLANTGSSISHADTVVNKDHRQDIVPELADDSLVEAFEHDLEMPRAEEDSSFEPQTHSSTLTLHDEDIAHFTSRSMMDPLLAEVVEVDSLVSAIKDNEGTTNLSLESSKTFHDQEDFNIVPVVVKQIVINEAATLESCGRVLHEPSMKASENDSCRIESLETIPQCVPDASSLSSTTPGADISELDISTILPALAPQSDRASLDSAEELSFIEPTTMSTTPTKLAAPRQENLSELSAMDISDDPKTCEFIPENESAALADISLHGVVPGDETPAKEISDDIAEPICQDLQEILSYRHTNDGESVDASASPSLQRQKRSSSRRQSRRQSYMTATKSAVRERELELQLRQADQEQADLQLAAEILDPPESLLEEMPGSVERKRTKRRSNSTSRRSPLFKGESEVISIANSEDLAEAETFSPIVLGSSNIIQDLLEKSAVTIQACFRGWRTRQALRSDEVHRQEESQNADTNFPSAYLSDVTDEFGIPAKEGAHRPSSKDSNLDNVFSDFLKQWQSKKSQKAKLDDLNLTSEKLTIPGTPRRTPAGCVSPQKGDKKTLVVSSALPSSAQKLSKVASTRTSRSRLPGPRNPTNSLSVISGSRRINSKQTENQRGLQVASVAPSGLQHDTAITSMVVEDDLVGREPDANRNDPSRKRTRVPKVSTVSTTQSNAPLEIRTKLGTNTQATNIVVPTTPKRLLYLTPAEVAKTTRNFTSQNRLYRCDFDRVVVRKEIQRPPSPTAKLQAKLATNARTKRRRLMKERGYTFGAGDEEDYVPKMVTPERKAVKWGEELEINLTSLPKTTPSKVKHIEEVASCIAPVALDDYGNVANNTPLTPELGKPPKVLITKYLYRGEQDDS